MFVGLFSFRMGLFFQWIGFWRYVRSSQNSFIWRQYFKGASALNFSHWLKMLCLFICFSKIIYPIEHIVDIFHSITEVMKKHWPCLWIVWQAAFRDSILWVDHNMEIEPQLNGWPSLLALRISVRASIGQWKSPQQSGDKWGQGKPVLGLHTSSNRRSWHVVTLTYGEQLLDIEQLETYT